MKNIVKSIYNFIPFKRQIFSALKFFGTPSQRFYQHLHFKGVIQVPVEGEKKFKIMHHGYQVENEIFWAGLTNGWEKQSIRLWIQLSKKATAVLDIGANTGLYSLITKSVNPSAKVVAFEPVERVYEKLVENIRLNDFDVIPVKKAASNANGRAVIYDVLSEHVYSVTVNKNMAAEGTEVVKTEIETITLNDFLKNSGWTNVDLVKIDVETHEPEVLEGFSEYLGKCKPSMLIEILNDEVAKKVSTLVEGLDYLYFDIDEIGSVKQVERISKSSYYNYFFCTPEIAREVGLPIHVTV